MGLLDDAIREHLELKRRHGADESDVRRQEHEALGPVQRTPAPSAEPEEPAEPEAPAPEEPVAEPLDAPLAPAEEAPAPEPTWVEPEEPEEEAWLDEPDEVPAGETLEHPTTPQPTAEFTPPDVEPSEVVAPDEEPADDVLEETPEFLQETPEHDRLWFEQKPPRDFDFDK
jgi:hypothetical protein